MSRPLRIEYAGALYHITARGNERRPIFKENADRAQFLEFLTDVIGRLAWRCHAYCLMDNHYHLLVETTSPNLSDGMRNLNGRYSRWFNQTHNRVGHLLQGRFKGILVEKDAYLMELARYIVLNPVRAQMVRHPEDWPWSSYRSTAGFSEENVCLSSDWLLSRFSTSRKKACLKYREFVAQGKSLPSPLQQLKNEVYLGSDRFVEDALKHLDPGRSTLDIPSIQKLAPQKRLASFELRYLSSEDAMVMAYLSGHYTLDEVGTYFGKSKSTVSRKVKAFEASGKWEV